MGNNQRTYRGVGKYSGNKLKNLKCTMVDANFLVAYVSPKTSEEDKARIDFPINSIEKSNGRIIIPMPAMAEYLVGADIAGIETINKLERKAYIYIAPFDRLAAFECALIDRAALGGGDKRDGSNLPWQKIKIDRQIVAIGKSLGATLVISQDEGVCKNALRVGINSCRIQELPLPESTRQHKLELIIDNAVG